MTSPLRRRRLLLAAAALSPTLLCAQPAERKVRLVFVPTVGAARLPGSRVGYPQWLGKRLAGEGFVVGRNLAIDYVDIDVGDSDLAGLERRAKDLLASRPDLILVGEDGVELMKRLTSEIPLVFYGFSGNPVAFGLVESYRRPGGNVTGSTTVAPEGEMFLTGWQLLKDLAPMAKRIGVLWPDQDLQERWAVAQRALAKATAPRLGLECVEVVYPTKASSLAAFERSLRAARVDLLDAINAPIDGRLPQVYPLLERMGLPSLWYDRAQVGAGGLISANGNPEEAMREAVAIAALVLKGTKPGEIAVRTPTQFEIAVNLRVARAMKIEVPPSVLLRASVKYEK